MEQRPQVDIASSNVSAASLSIAAVTWEWTAIVRAGEAGRRQHRQSEGSIPFKYIDPIRTVSKVRWGGC